MLSAACLLLWGMAADVPMGLSAVFGSCDTIRAAFVVLSETVFCATRSRSPWGASCRRAPSADRKSGEGREGFACYSERGADRRRFHRHERPRKADLLRVRKPGRTFLSRCRSGGMSGRVPQGAAVLPRDMKGAEPAEWERFESGKRRFIRKKCDLVLLLERKVSHPASGDVLREGSRSGKTVFLSSAG